MHPDTTVSADRVEHATRCNQAIIERRIVLTNSLKAVFAITRGDAPDAAMRVLDRTPARLVREMPVYSGGSASLR